MEVLLANETEDIKIMFLETKDFLQKGAANFARFKTCFCSEGLN